MEVRKSVIDGQFLDVYKYEEYVKNPQAYNNNCAVLEDGYIYPVRKINDNRPGIYTAGPRATMVVFEKPRTPEEKKIYSQDNLIDFTGNNMRELIENTEILNEREREILTNVNNLFKPAIKQEDSPAMSGLKEATCEKDFDISSYKHRFGANYNNTLKLYENDDVTLKKLGYIGERLDMKVTITIEDASPDVPNPIGRVITRVITGTGVEE